MEADVSDDDVSVEMSIPVDSDGFLRRECPTCEREFKWLHTPQEDAAYNVAPDGSYFCPYCGVQAEAGSWLTKDQVELAQKLVANRVVGPMLEEFADDLRCIGRRSKGMVRTEVTHAVSDEPDPLTEIDDMILVEFTCHPEEPVKVLEDWDRTTFCLVCGQPKT
jgi:hypothetical protein